MSDIVTLNKKTALVTGAARRMGEAVALGLARANCNVILHYRTSGAAANALAERLRDQGVRAWTSCADLADPAQATQLMDHAIRDAGPIDFLINNAGIFPEQSLRELSPDDVHANIDINAVAPLLLVRRFAAQDREGAVVNFLDARIVDYDREHVPYHLSKRMLYTLTRMMAVEFAPKVRVNAVAPGLVLPPEGKDAGYLEGLKHTNPLNRYGSAGGVVEAVLFLLRSGFVTGQVIFVDGGRHLRGGLYG